MHFVTHILCLWCHTDFIGGPVALVSVSVVGMMCSAVGCSVSWLTGWLLMLGVLDFSHLPSWISVVFDELGLYVTIDY